MGELLDEPVLILKSCIGNRSLGWDLLPPGSERYTVDGKTYAGYKDTPDSWIEGQPKPANDNEMPQAMYYLVEASFAQAMGVTLERGRTVIG